MSDYTVFVDESFFRWFGLPTQESNLCYGALSIPTARLPDLQRFEYAIRRFTFDKLPVEVRAKRSVDEIKYTDLKHLTPGEIDHIGEKYNYFLTKCSATIFGFFIPASGFMNYKLRSDFIDDPDRLRSLGEEQYNERIDGIRKQMLQEWKDAEHNVGLLTECYKTFFGFILQFHGRYLRKSYRIVYDSRIPEEDAQLHREAEDFSKIVDRVTPGVFAYYKGYEPGSSSDSPGLRLVDWVAGEVRNFFYRNPEVLEGDSRLDILSPYLNPKMILLENRAPFYRRELSEGAIACFEQKGKGFLMPHIKDHFASGFLTYYARHGEARHVSIPHLVALDMAD